MRFGYLLFCFLLAIWIAFFSGCKPAVNEQEQARRFLNDSTVAATYGLRQSVSIITSEISLQRNLNIGLTETNSVLLKEIEVLYTSKGIPDSLYQSVLKFHQQRLFLDSFLEHTRSDLIAECEEISKEAADTIIVSELNNPFEIKRVGLVMIGPDESNITGRSKLLKEYIVVFCKQANLLDTSGKHHDFREAMPTDLYSKKLNRMISWEWFHFARKTQVEVLLTFLELKNSFLVAENHVYTDLISAVK